MEKEVAAVSKESVIALGSRNNDLVLRHRATANRCNLQDNHLSETPHPLDIKFPSFFEEGASLTRLVRLVGLRVFIYLEIRRMTKCG